MLWDPIETLTLKDFYFSGILQDVYSRKPLSINKMKGYTTITFKDLNQQKDLYPNVQRSVEERLQNSG
jgi:hypothetical protein